MTTTASQGEGPSIRVSIVKAQLKAVRSLPEAQQRAVLDRIPRELISKVDGLPSTGWLSLSENAVMIRAAYSALNEQAFGELMYKASLNTVEHPLFRGALNFVLRAAGVKPKTLVKAIPAGWPLTWKDCGLLTFVDRGQPNQAELVWTDVPLEILSETALMKSFPHGFAAMLSFVNVQANVEYVIRHREAIGRLHGVLVGPGKGPISSSCPSGTA